MIPPAFVGAARHVDAAVEAMMAVPMTAAAVRQAAAALHEADALLGPELAAFASPPAWCQAHGLNGMNAVTLFNQFNEAADAVEQAQKLDNGLVWQMAPESRRYVQTKLDALMQAQRSLSPELYRMYRAGAADGELAATVTSPWVRWSGVRYGYDVGRFRRAETFTAGTHEAIRHVEVVPMPWGQGGVPPIGAPTP